MPKASSLATFKNDLEKSTHVAWREQHTSQPVKHRKDTVVFYVCDHSQLSRHNCALLAPESPLLHTPLREKILKLAKEHGLSVFPAFNVDLNQFNRAAKIEFALPPSRIILEIYPNGNLKAMYRGVKNLLWFHGGGKAGIQVSVQLIEKALCKDWKVTVIATSKSGLGVALKLTRDTPNGILEMNVGIGKGSENAGWFVVYASLDKKEFDLGDYRFVGDFGFKIKIKGDINILPNMENMSKSILFQDVNNPSEDTNSLWSFGLNPTAILFIFLCMAEKDQTIDMHIRNKVLRFLEESAPNPINSSMAIPEPLPMVP